MTKKKYDDEYFVNRNLTDEKRKKQFEIDNEFLSKYLSKGKVCDVGCSTAEFLRHVNWQGEKYGMEINEYAKKIASDIIRFDKNIYTENNFFDGVIFRGTLQLVDRPFEMLERTYAALKHGGFLYICATPNTSSILYKLKGDLPFIEWDKIYYVPESKTLSQALQNIGFEIIEIKYPYLGTPYCNLVNDHWKFFKNVIFKKYYPHAFWGNSISLIAKKPSVE